jgi:hypothetical protein
MQFTLFYAFFKPRNEIMIKTIPMGGLSSLPDSSQAITLNLRPLARCGNCQGDGKLAFGLPWITVTALGTFATIAHPDSVFAVQAIVPGLMAGASGLILYKATKWMVKHLRKEMPQTAL